MPITRVELPRPTLDQKWRTAESNLICFVVCGIAYAKSKGESPEDFGTFAGEVAAPSWEEEAKGKGPQALVEGVSLNMQQFRNFQIAQLTTRLNSIPDYVAVVIWFSGTSVWLRPASIH